MRLADIIRTKGDAVVTIAPEATVTELLALLAQHNIGAVVVSADGNRVEGIVSERDVVRALASDGPGVLTATVASLATTEVACAAPDDEVASVAATMTVGRFRHMPVLIDGRLGAIVSIGDVVKYRIDALTHERDQLIGYIHR